MHARISDTILDGISGGIMESISGRIPEVDILEETHLKFLKTTSAIPWKLRKNS